MNKMFDYMMAELPVLCAITAPDNPVSVSQGGIMVESGDVNGITSAILKLRDMSDKERSNMGEKGKAYIMNHATYQILSQQFADLFTVGGSR